MNRIYRSIWNDTSGTFVAAPEHANSAGKKSSSGATAAASAGSGGARFALKGLALSLMLSFGTHLYALPTGGVVAAGSASIAGSAGTMTINQSSQNAAINWQSFNIGATEAVRFVQPNSNSVALNRVLGSDPSSILGRLSANGQVFLLNPNGILFGQGASVNVGALLASTLNITDSDFMAGRYKFSGSSGAAILNQGAINADGGYVALLGAKVSNEGVISARLGTVTLAAGNAITLDVAGDGLLNVTVNQGAVNALVQNGGLLRADGGQVLLSAQSAGRLLQSAVNNTGVIRAQTLENRNGSIRLLGDMQSGSVSVGGTLDVSGLGAGRSGGSVTATGQHVGLFGGMINASGDAGGGTVLIGGGYQGQNPAVQNAGATYMSADSTITADAITNGSGGTVVLWADDSTRAYGSITARGGAQGGDGGLIETSGHYLDVAGIKVDTSAPNGQYGMWLLDPADVTITGAATSGGSFSGGATNVFSPGSGESTANVAVADITTALLTTGVTINTVNTGAAGVGSGDITIGTPLVAAAITWTAPTTLTLNAVRDVTVNLGSAITATNGSLVVNAGRDIAVNAATKTTTGSLTFTAVGNVDMTAATTVTTGNISAIAGGNTNVTAAMTVTTGDIILRGDNDGTGPGAAAGTVNITCGSNCLTITTGALRIRFNPASYATTGAETTAYAANLTGGGSLDAKAWVFGKGDNKIYDGTTVATVTGLKPDIAGVAPAATLGTVTNANFDTKHVGTNKLITYDSTFADAVFDLFAPFGTPAGTYTTRANITVRPLTVSAVPDTRVYNGTTSSVGVPTVTGLQVGDAPVDTLNGPLTQAFASKNVLGTGNSILVATGPYSVNDGNNGNNYTVSVINAPGTITQAPLTIRANDATKVYGQTFTPASTAFTVPVPPIPGETVASVTLVSPAGTPPTAAVPGPYAITPSNAAANGAFLPSNYTITYLDGALTVTPRALVGSITAANKPYDATTAATITSRTLTGAINGDAVSYSGGSATFDTPDPGTGKTVTGTGLGLSGANAGNYTVNSTAITTADIAPMVVAPPFAPPVVASPVTPVNWMPAAVRTPPELLTLAPAIVPVVVPPAVPVAAPPVVQQPAPVVVPAETPPQIYVAPVRPRKQDRN